MDIESKCLVHFKQFDSEQSPFGIKPKGAIQIQKAMDKHLYNVIATEYSNPFEPEGNQKLIHLSSGVELSDDIAKSILSLPSVGQELHEEFRKTRLLSTSVSFHHKLTRVKRLSFSDTKTNQQRSAREMKLFQRTY